ncbi:leucine-rich repeat protein [Oribacterium sp. WCC10]|uniref:leucine-rich repeat protein n=1 Tax=Oribacterium sp. WCC10 TaxID=1855343 RepID=UPI0008E2AD39|nr:leucine-rich repeat protein [Oribacterium sp. WCC10]SFG15412.1 Leucine rich repeat-containing protein [Oribacterium sp. WCC10]
MALTYEVKNEKGTFIASVTGYEGPVRTLFVPEYLVENPECEASGNIYDDKKTDNENRPAGAENDEVSAGNAIDGRMSFPIAEINNQAFASRDDIESVILSDKVKRIRPYAFHNCHHLHYMKLTDSVIDYYDGAIRQCLELQEIDITFNQRGNFRLLKEIIGDSDAMIPVLVHFPVDEEYLRADEMLKDLPDRAVKREEVEKPDGSFFMRTMVTAALTFPSYADNYEEDTFSRAFHEHIEGSGYNTRQLVTRTGIDFSGYDRQFQRFTYDEPASAVNAAFGRLMYPWRLSEENKEQYREYLRKHSPEILPKLIRGQKAPRFGHEGELVWIPQDRRRTDEKIRFMVDEELIAEDAIAPALEVASQEGAVLTSAMLMDYQNRYFRSGVMGGMTAGPETFEL